MKKRVYLDYAAAAPVRPEVLEAMESHLAVNFANPSALYQEAEKAREALERSRQKIACLLGVKTGEVIFVSGSTEANNLAILGFAQAEPRPGRIVTTAIEHPSILGPVRAIEKKGWRVTKLDVNEEGLLSLERFTKELEPSLRGSSSKLVSFAWANPDIGAVQPAREIIKAAAGLATIHLDASQAVGLLELSVPSLGADLVTVSSAKISGPRGIAALIVRGVPRLEPLIWGGGQEKGIRSGTENVAAAVGFACALELAVKERPAAAARLSELRDTMLEAVPAEIPDAVVTGPSLATVKKLKRSVRLSNHASFAFKDVDGEELVIRLDEAGFAVGTGTACATGKNEISPAVKALNLPLDYERGTLRVTLGVHTAREEIDDFIRTLRGLVANLRTRL